MNELHYNTCDQKQTFESSTIQISGYYWIWKTNIGSCWWRWRVEVHFGGVRRFKFLAKLLLFIILIDANQYIEHVSQIKRAHWTYWVNYIDTFFPLNNGENDISAAIWIKTNKPIDCLLSTNVEPLYKKPDPFIVEQIVYEQLWIYDFSSVPRQIFSAISLETCKLIELFLLSTDFHFLCGKCRFVKYLNRLVWTSSGLPTPI